VPEAAVHEDGEADMAENKVRLAEHGLMAAPAHNAMASQQLHKCDLGTVVATAANAGH
jgi:hypothetical protein